MSSKEDKDRRKKEKEADIAFSKSVKARDFWQCAICNSHENLHCHHILPRERRDLRHDFLNAITLCCLHHKFSLEISPHKNAFEFFVWLERNRPQQFEYLKGKVKMSNILIFHVNEDVQQYVL